ncbi:MAG: hypothetical protein PVJ57_06825 [Phycisphaerae bacterium]|jgi:hypothetical protein
MPEVPNQPPETPPTAPGRDVDGAAPARPAVAAQPKPAWRRTWIAGAVLLTLLGYFLVWQRGFYNDDYANYIISHDAETGARKTFFYVLTVVPTARGLSYMLARNSVLLIADGYEVLVRAMFAGAAALNAVLIGWLAYRLLRSWFAATVAVLLALSCAPMHQAMLWTTGGNYLLMTLFTLVYLHAFLFVIEGVRPGAVWWLVGTVAFLGALLIVEQHVGVLGLLVAFGAILAVQPQRTERYRILRRAVFVPLWPMLLSAVCFLWLYGESKDINTRGGLVTALPIIYGQCKEILRLAPELLVTGQARAMLREGSVIGLEKVCGSWLGLAMLIVGGGLMLTPIGWRSRRDKPPQPWYVGVLTMLAALAGALVVLLFPLCLVSFLYVESRQLYVPYLLLAVGAAAALWLIARIVRHDGFRGFMLCLLGVLFVVHTLVTVGFAEAYARRSALDQRQLADLTAVIRSEDLPHDARVVPLAVDQVTFPEYPALDHLLHGGFEIEWAAEALLRTAYHRYDLYATVPYTRDWGTRFKVPTAVENAGRIIVQDKPHDPATTLVFTWRDGEVRLIRDLHVLRDSGEEYVVSFPLAVQIGERGAPLVDVAVREALPVREIVEYEPAATQSAPASQPGGE